MKKRLFSVLAIVLAFSLFSMSALAADLVEIEDTEYTEAAEGTGNQGGTWAWDGANDLQFNDFKSDSGVWIEGDITITVTGDNEIGGYGLDVGSSGEFNETGEYEEKEAGDLTITGDGTLTVNSEEDWDNDGIWSSGDVTIKDTTVNVSVTAPADSEGTPVGIIANNITIDNSEVNIDLSPDGILAVAQGDYEYEVAPTLDGVGAGEPTATGTPGKITLVNAQIETDGISIRDYTGFGGTQGQILAPGEGPIDLSDPDFDMSTITASHVTIKPVAPTAKAAAITTAGKTGDSSDASMWITAMLIAGAFIVSAVSRKRAH